MGQLRRRAGVFAALGRLRLRDLATPEIVAGVVLGAGGGVLAAQKLDVAERVTVAGDFLAMTPALVGVVFAGLSLVVALLSDSYMAYLEDAPDGLVGFLGNFILAIGGLVTTLVACVAYRATATALPTGVEPWFFGTLAVLFGLSSLDIIALARSVLMHGLAKARAAKLTALEPRREARNRAL